VGEEGLAVGRGGGGNLTNVTMNPPYNEDIPINMGKN
jgi:hypothetical protein